MKLSRVARLVSSNFWVGSTPAQSPTWCEGVVGEGKGWVRGGVGNVADCDVVMGYAFFIIKNALLLNLYLQCVFGSANLQPV